jgi:hypothetical protein
MTEPPTELELRVFVDCNSDYYLTAWKPALTDGGFVRQFNLSAFFLGALWLAYRKMYLEAVMLVGVGSAISFVSALVCLFVFRDPLLIRGTTTIVGFAIGGYVAAHANHWYLVRALNAIERVRNSGLSPDAQVLAIARRGGTNPFSAILVFAGVVIVAAICLEALTEQLPLYQLYDR